MSFELPINTSHFISTQYYCLLDVLATDIISLILSEFWFIYYWADDFHSKLFIKCIA